MEWADISVNNSKFQNGDKGVFASNSVHLYVMRRWCAQPTATNRFVSGRYFQRFEVLRYLLLRNHFKQLPSTLERLIKHQTQTAKSGVFALFPVLLSMLVLEERLLVSLWEQEFSDLYIAYVPSSFGCLPQLSFKPATARKASLPQCRAR